MQGGHWGQERGIPTLRLELLRSHIPSSLNDNLDHVHVAVESCAVQGCCSTPTTSVHQRGLLCKQLTHRLRVAIQRGDENIGYLLVVTLRRRWCGHGGLMPQQEGIDRPPPAYEWWWSRPPLMKLLIPENAC